MKPGTKATLAGIQRRGSAALNSIFLVNMAGRARRQADSVFLLCGNKGGVRCCDFSSWVNEGYCVLSNKSKQCYFRKPVKN